MTEGPVVKEINVSSALILPGGTRTYIQMISQYTQKTVGITHFVPSHLVLETLGTFNITTNYFFLLHLSSFINLDTN
jgi:hypothetical protein